MKKPFVAARLVPQHRYFRKTRAKQKLNSEK